jgi:hypothetical protein
MSTGNGRTPEDVRRDIETEREELGRALESLRSGIGEVTDVRAQLREHLAVATAAAVGAGFVLGGGLRATTRLLMNRGRHGRRRLKVGRYTLVED